MKIVDQKSGIRDGTPDIGAKERDKSDRFDSSHIYNFGGQWERPEVIIHCEPGV